MDSATHPYAQIGVLSLNRPKSRNALSKALIDALHAHLTRISQTERIRGLLIESSTPGIFCAGADLVERRTMTALQTSDFLDSLRQTLSLLSRMPMPTCSVVEGHALGGGLELALATDFRVLGARATLGLPETSLGIIPGAGGTQRIMRLLGPTRAKDLIFTARRLGATEADNLGLGELSDAPRDRALTWLESCLGNSPLAIQCAKRAIDEHANAEMERGLDFEREMYDVCMTSPDRQEGLEAFQERRKPIYGRDPSTSVKSKL